MHSKDLSSAEDIIAEARAGRMFILVDDEARENEGDLIIPAQFATPQAINFMAMHGRGLICLAMTRERTQQLELNLMSRENGSRHQTAFTVSIEAREGVTTGISAADRAHTIQVAIDPSKGAKDIASPGHVFPLVAKDGGVLVRAGHTEAAVDIARLAGVIPAGVICEIMNDDGTMARLPELIIFAKKHGLKIGAIADLISHRRRSEKLVRRVVESTFSSRFGGDFKMIVYTATHEYAEHIALVKGDISGASPVLVRMHSLNLLHDLLGDTHAGRPSALQPAMEQIAKHGSGVIVLIREPIRTLVSDQLRPRVGEEPLAPMDLRDYGIGAQILLDLGVQDMILLSNSKRSVIGLEGYGLRIVEYQPIESQK
ncbi:MAG: 3,4-dihydroxy-2-butanone-4-phosphate synthase [Alphaproteobacteria bacterium]|nr:3,4-dihydroxy-2-butanone-4-phosphate synthase [Alphaproteobacteria bacterium]